MFERLLSSSCLSPVSLPRLPFLFHSPPILCPAHHLQCRERRGLKPLHSRRMRSIAPWRYTILSQVMSRTSLTTSTALIRSPRTCVTRNSTMRPSGKRYLRHCSFRSEKNQLTGDKLITLKKKVCCQLQSFFAHTSTERPVFELGSCQERKESREMESERIRIVFERQKEQIFAEVRTEIQKHEFQADSDRRSILELNGMHCAHMGVLFLMETAYFVCAIRERARDLLRSGHSGPKTITASWPQSFPSPALCASTPSPSGPNALLVFTSFTGVSPAPHGAFSIMTHLVVPLCVPGRPRLHGQGQLSQHRGCPK